MNGLDNAIVCVAIFGAVYGASRGVLRMVTSAPSLAAGVYFASLYHAAAGAKIEALVGPHGYHLGANVIAVLGYIAVFATVFAGVETAGNLLIRIFHAVHLNWADRLGGSVVDRKSV